MISYHVYKVMHLTGVLMAVMGVGALAIFAVNGGGKNHKFFKQASATHGIGLLIALVGGFGLLARLGVAHGMLPGWAIAKLVIWFLLGACASLFIRKPEKVKAAWLVIIFLTSTAAYLANYKPF